MKPKFLVAALVSLGLVLPGIAGAKSFELEDLRKPPEKLGRGVLNVALSPLEIINTFVDEGASYRHPVDNSDNFIEFVISAPLIAVGRTLIRAGVGVVDVVTFPFPLPQYGYDELYDPEYVRPFWEIGED